jgi:hypothetical protein
MTFLKFSCWTITGVQPTIRLFSPIPAFSSYYDNNNHLQHPFSHACALSKYLAALRHAPGKGFKGVRQFVTSLCCDVGVTRGGGKNSPKLRDVIYGQPQDSI